MYMICPDCRGTMVALNEKKARCTMHGGQYDILFSRVTLVTPPLAPSEDDAVSSEGLNQQKLTTLAPPGLMCMWHPTVTATQCCQGCGALICSVCDFPTPQGGHVCPVCITKPASALADSRKKYQSLLIWGYVLPGFVTIMLVVLVVLAVVMGDNGSALEVIGTLMGLSVPIPALIGIGLSVAALDKHSPYHGAAWGALIWNGILLSIFVLLVIIGSVSGG
ncbi:MAG: hypothetical protein ACYDBB_19050 [Armatimonadota bacterium]